MTSPLAGKRVLVTRERPGELGAMLEARGATVVHVPLIAIREPADGGEHLRRELGALRNFDWLVVTSVPGAERVGRAAAETRRVSLAAVGSATARVLADLAGRPVDLLPSVQRATALADLLIERFHGVRSRVLVAQADRADSTLVDRLIEAGHDVTACVAYRTVLLRPDASTVADADALVLASGSSAQAWVEAFGRRTPPVVVAIGPTTATVAERFGLKVSSVATDSSLAGLLAELERCV
ncbi:MAG: uroporphyrinogen-III synthase [Ilumatobacteraceae bacterium]